MAGTDDEKLVLHVREGLVVHDLLEEASLRLGGLSLDCSCPGFERRGVEGIREEVAIFSCHRYINYGGKVLMVCGPECKDRHPMGWESKEEVACRPGGVKVRQHAMPNLYRAAWRSFVLERRSR